MFYLIGFPLAAAPADAQVEVEALVRGSVTRAGEGVPAAEVTLHRVGQDSAGVLDVQTANGDGSFRFLLPRLPNPSASDDVYFASVEYQGIMYFGPPISTPADLDSLYVIAVHDTAVVGEGTAEVAIQTRTLVLDQTQDGWSVTDLFELRNDTDRTLVPGGGLVWSHPLPLGASEFELGESDLPSDAVTFQDGLVTTSAPVPPGTRLYLFRYSVASPEFTIPQRGSERFELLIREPARAVEVDGLRSEAPITPDQGTTYRRFAGLDLVPSEIGVRESSQVRGLPLAPLTLGLGFALALLGLWVFRRGSGSPEDRRARIVLEIARLDEAFEGRSDPTPEEVSRYRRKRAALANSLTRQR